jgi:peroxiredoxin
MQMIANRRGRRIATAVVMTLALAALWMPQASAQLSSSAERAQIGAKIKDFTLKDTDGKEHKLSDYTSKGKTVVLEWFNPGCPFVVRHHESEDTPMKEAYKAFKEKDVVWLAINSGAPGKQGHGVELNARKKKDWGIEYPILIDESGEVGKYFGARTTPHMYVISADSTLVYMGAIDDDPRGRSDDATNYVADALTAHLAGKDVGEPETRPYGCGVKYGS